MFMKTPERTDNPVSEYIVSPIFEPFREAARNIGGKILEFPLKVAEGVINAPIQWVHDAAAAVVGFPVKGK